MLVVCFRERTHIYISSAHRSRTNTKHVLRKRERTKRTRTNLRKPFPDHLARRRRLSRLVFDAISFQFPESSRHVFRRKRRSVINITLALLLLLLLLRRKSAAKHARCCSVVVSSSSSSSNRRRKRRDDRRRARKEEKKTHMLDIFFSLKRHLFYEENVVIFSNLRLKEYTHIHTIYTKRDMQIFVKTRAFLFSLSLCVFFCFFVSSSCLCALKSLLCSFFFLSL
jgi:hypothetical protein